jgi:hypothetical protein
MEVELNMKTRIKLYGEIAGEIWMPAVRCVKTFELNLIRVSRNSTTLTFPGIAPRSMEITSLRDALLHLTNDGDFQSCGIAWGILEVSHSFGNEADTRSTIGRRTRVCTLRGIGQNADCFCHE